MTVIPVWLSFKQRRNYAAKISNLTSTEKIWARAITLDLTFFSFGFYIFEVFSSLLNSRRRLQDVQTETIRSERVDNHLCLRVLRHAQQQDKLNAKRIIHGICSIFRLFLYQINTKFVLTVSRRIHFLSSIHQHLNHAPQKKKTNKCEETWRHRDATTATLQQTRFIVIRKHFCGNSADFVRARGIFGWRRWRCSKDYRQQGVKQFARFA